MNLYFIHVYKAVFVLCADVRKFAWFTHLLSLYTCLKWVTFFHWALMSRKCRDTQTLDTCFKLIYRLKSTFKKHSPNEHLMFKTATNVLNYIVWNCMDSVLSRLEIIGWNRAVFSSIFYPCYTSNFKPSVTALRHQRLSPEKFLRIWCLRCMGLWYYSTIESRNINCNEEPRQWL